MGGGGGGSVPLGIAGQVSREGPGACRKEDAVVRAFVPDRSGPRDELRGLDMAESKLERSVQLGLLDRLIDLEPENRAEAPMSRSESLRRLRLAVKRDLEYLLNTTRLPLELPEGCP